jgi:hypothetical protein
MILNETIIRNNPLKVSLLIILKPLSFGEGWGEAFAIITHYKTINAPVGLCTYGNQQIITNPGTGVKQPNDQRGA